jgi:hypothetical protein
MNADLIVHEEELKDGDSGSSVENIEDQESGCRRDAGDRPNDSMRKLVQDGGDITFRTK